MGDSASSNKVDLDFVLTEISYDEILLVWKNHLWPARQSIIEPYSAININGIIDGRIIDLKPKSQFYAAYQGNEIVAVTSFHLTHEKQYRLRGTWVAEQYRGCGMGRKLILKVINNKFQNGDIIWTLSRETSRSFYEKSGFVFFKTVIGYEYGPHCVMILNK